jgi:hypothetical protein
MANAKVTVEERRREGGKVKGVIGDQVGIQNKVFRSSDNVAACLGRLFASEDELEIQFQLACGFPF